MIQPFDGKETCCGCGVCMAVCRRNAIQMRPDEEGFLYPQINLDNCVDCGKCKKVCPMHNHHEAKKDFHPSIFAACHKNEITRMHSQSGGLFPALSDVVLGKSGAVYGAGFESNLSVIHQRAVTKVERDALCGSKYVQSDMRSVLPLIAEDLSSGKSVLFSGTPCQCAGVGKLFENHDMLYLCDLVCHGTPSPKLWREYLFFYNKKYDRFPGKAVFRNKSAFGWHDHTETLFIGGKAYNNNIWADLFYGHNALRPSCYRCPFSNMNRKADVTMGDFWGIEDVAPEFKDDNKGISIALINTQKGAMLFSNASNTLTLRRCDQINFQKQPYLQTPVQRPDDRDIFWEDYHSFGFSYIAKKYAGVGLPKRVKTVLKQFLMQLGLYNKMRKIKDKMR